MKNVCMGAVAVPRLSRVPISGAHLSRARMAANLPVVVVAAYTIICNRHTLLQQNKEKIDDKCFVEMETLIVVAENNQSIVVGVIEKYQRRSWPMSYTSVLTTNDYDL